MTTHIQIRGITPRIQYVGDGESCTFEFPFAIFTDSNLAVYIGDTLQEATAYSVSREDNVEGGSITFTTAPASGDVITLCRQLDIERTSDFQEGSALRAKVLNDELDYQIACLQEVADNLNRSMVLPPYALDPDSNLTLPTPTAGKALVWNADGTNLENSTVAINDITSTLNGYVTTAQTAAGTATSQAQEATAKAQAAATSAQTASDKADIATQKATDAANSAAAVADALSTKANASMDNLTGDGSSKTAMLAMPSTTYVDIPFTGFDKTYSLDVNASGYVVFSGNAGSGSGTKYVHLSAGVKITSRNSGNYNHEIFIPLKKGTPVYLDGNLTGTVSMFRFYYARGDV